MEWLETGQLHISETDLAVLGSPVFAGKAWNRPEAWIAGEPGFPPAVSAVFLCMLANHGMRRTGLFWREYRRLLELSNYTGLFYRRFAVWHNGKRRVVCRPAGFLEGYQRWILRNILERAPVSEHAYAYRRGFSLCDHARVHAGQPMLVKLDIRGFFNAVSFGMVYGVFRERMGYPKESAVLLSRLCCLDGHLPQGACTSPCLSNLCFLPIDNMLHDYCGARNIRYTRYSDDMIFSGDGIDTAALIAFVKETLRPFGFRLNYDKIRVAGKGSRHRVTGLVCNEKVAVPAAYRRGIRQEMYYLKKYGARDVLLRRNDARWLRPDGSPDTERYLHTLCGRVQFVLQAEPDRAEFLEYREWLVGQLICRIVGACDPDEMPTGFGSSFLPPDADEDLPF